MRRRGALLSIAVAVLAFAAAAFAATGKLAPKGCIDDGDLGQGPDTCAVPTDGLDGAADIAISPDGNTVYAVSQTDDAIVRFKRSDSGALKPKDCIDDNDNATDANQGPDACAQETDGMNGANAVAVSPDGQSVYVAAQLDSAIVHFDRDPDTGALTPVGCVEDDTPEAADACADETSGLFAAWDIAVSPGGESVYAASLGDDALVAFDRDLGSGVLSPAGCIRDATTASGCAETAPALNDAQGVVVSPSGNSVYVAARIDDAVSRFNRAADGSLQYKGCLEDPNLTDSGCDRDAIGLDGVDNLAISGDGATLYGGGLGALTTFARDPATGKLKTRGCVEDNGATPGCAKSSPGLAGLTSIAVSADGLSLYSTSNNEDALVRFARDPATGKVSPKTCVEDTATGFDNECLDGSVAALGDASVGVLSPDDSSYYIVGFSDDSVVRFKRSLGL